MLINIDVSDAEIGVRFYGAAFGLKIGRRFGKDFVELLGWAASVYLLTKKITMVFSSMPLLRSASSRSATLRSHISRVWP